MLIIAKIRPIMTSPRKFCQTFGGLIKLPVLISNLKVIQLLLLQQMFLQV